MKPTKPFFATLIILVIVLFVLSACLTGCTKQGKTPANESIQSQTGEKTEIPAEPIEKEPKTDTMASKVTEKAAEPKEKKEIKTIPNEIKEIINKAAKAKSYSYDYTDSEALVIYKFSVKGDKARLQLPKALNVNNMFIDTVYFSINASKAVAYCERLFHGGYCPEPNKAFEISFDAFFKRTPYQWLNSIEYADFAGGSENINNREVQPIVFEKDGTSTKMWLDLYYGLPLRVEETKGSKKITYDFLGMAFNSVKDEEVEHQNIS